MPPVILPDGVYLDGPNAPFSGKFDVRVGRLRLPTVTDGVSEALGGDIEQVGLNVSAGDRKPRTLSVELPVYGPSGTATDPYLAAMRARRQIRQLMQNERARLAGLYFRVAADRDLNGWAVCSGGDLAYSEGGTSTGEFKLTLRDFLMIASSAEARIGMLLDAYDTSFGLSPRDYLKKHADVGFFGNRKVSFVALPPGTDDIMTPDGLVKQRPTIKSASGAMAYLASGDGSAMGTGFLVTAEEYAERSTDGGVLIFDRAGLPIPAARFTNEFLEPIPQPTVAVNAVVNPTWWTNFSSATFSFVADTPYGNQFPGCVSINVSASGDNFIRPKTLSPSSMDGIPVAWAVPFAIGVWFKPSVSGKGTIRVTYYDNAAAVLGTDFISVSPVATSNRWGFLNATFFPIDSGLTSVAWARIEFGFRAAEGVGAGQSLRIFGPTHTPPPGTTTNIVLPAGGWPFSGHSAGYAYDDIAPGSRSRGPVARINIVKDPRATSTSNYNAFGQNTPVAPTLTQVTDGPFRDKLRRSTAMEASGSGSAGPGVPGYDPGDAVTVELRYGSSTLSDSNRLPIVPGQIIAVRAWGKVSSSRATLDSLRLFGYVYDPGLGTETCILPMSSMPERRIPAPVVGQWYELTAYFFIPVTSNRYVGFSPSVAAVSTRTDIVSTMAVRATEFFVDPIAVDTRGFTGDDEGSVWSGAENASWSLRFADPQEDWGWEEVYGQLARPQIPGESFVLSNGICRLWYDDAADLATPAFRVQLFDGDSNSWYEQGVLQLNDNDGATTEYGYTMRSVEVAEWTLERAVLHYVLAIENSDGAHRNRADVYVTLERGWTGPKIEAYLQVLAAGHSIGFAWSPNLPTGVPNGTVVFMSSNVSAFGTPNYYLGQPGLAATKVFSTIGALQENWIAATIPQGYQGASAYKRNLKSIAFGFTDVNVANAVDANTGYASGKLAKRFVMSSPTFTDPVGYFSVQLARCAAPVDVAASSVTGDSPTLSLQTIVNSISTQIVRETNTADPATTCTLLFTHSDFVTYFGAAAGMYRLMLYMSAASASAYDTNFTDDAGSVIHVSNSVATSLAWYTGGDFYYGGSTLGSDFIRLRVYRTTGTSANVNIDRVLILPLDQTDAGVNDDPRTMLGNGLRDAAGRALVDSRQQLVLVGR